MALSVEQQLRYWGIGLVLFVGFLWLFSDVLFPYIAGMAIAYFMDPIADRLQRMGFSRLWATITLTLIAGVAFLVVLALVVPAVVQQAAELARVLPSYVEQGWSFLQTRFPALTDENSALSQQVQEYIEQFRGQAGTILGALVNSAFGAVNVVITLIITPIVSFYLLMDWDRLVAQIDSALPRDHLKTLRELASDVNSAIAGFVRGQLSVCAILGTFYAIALMLAGLNGGLVIGLIAGLLTFIPYVGAIIGGVLSIGLALFQFYDVDQTLIEYAWRVGPVAIIFFVGQFVEGNFLTPNMVGNSIGLHPVWLLFALSAFGSLFGFTGMLIAVPVAAVIGVFARFGLERYRNSKLYRGVSPSEEEHHDDA
ncbi:MAG: AI-2E family transporter [Pseudomonadota bacterium]